MSARKQKRLKRVAAMRQRLETIVSARAAQKARVLSDARDACTTLREEQQNLAGLPMESAADLASRAALLQRSRGALEVLEERAEVARDEWALAQKEAEQARSKTRAVERALERLRAEDRARAQRAEQLEADEFAGRMHATESST